MKKKIYFIISLFLLITINACTGYKPIFSSANPQLEIVDHSIKGNKKLGNQIYSQLHKLFKTGKNKPNVKTVHMTIETSKDNNATVKNSAGKILEYKVTINANIILKDFLSNDEILNYNVSYSSSYKVENKYSDTRTKERKITENLIDNISQDLLIRMSKITSTE